MKSKSIRSENLKKDSLKKYTHSDFCQVSNASIEIMLDRFTKGKSIEFPFST